MENTFQLEDGTSIEFSCPHTIESRWVTKGILAGTTYPYIPFVDDVQVVVDVGANCGATTVFLALHYPDAQVHAIEPGSVPWSFLQQNIKPHPNVRSHRVGLHSVDQKLPLYRGEGDSIITNSIFRRSVNSDESEMVELRAADRWAAEQGIDRIDVLKVDVEGCEVEVLKGLEDLLPTVKVLYVEYDSRQNRRDIAPLLEPTHELFAGAQFLDQGEIVYLRADVANHSDANPFLLRQFMRGMGA